MKKLLLTLYLCTIIATAPTFISAQANQTPRSSGAQTPAASSATAHAATVSNEVLALRQKAFDIVWRTVNEKHYDPTFGGVDWARVRSEYEPRVAQMKTDAEFHRLLQKMLSELHLSHFQIAPPEAVAATTTAKPAEAGGANLDVRVINRRVVITRIEPNSTAARAGLRPGFVLTKIDDTSIADLLQRVAATSKTPEALSGIIPRIVHGLLSGTVGTDVRILFMDEADRERGVTFKREPLSGEMTPPFGNFPSVRTEFEAKRLANNIAYIRFNIFVIPQMERIRRAIREMADAPGMIFDLRGNPGGIGAMANGITGLLTKEQVSLGTMQMRSGHINFIAYPQERAYTGAVVVLVDSMSASTSEIFAAGLQELKRAHIVGERTAGAALPSVFEKLPTGALFQYAIADFKTPKGKLIEGDGVTPDQQVLLTRASLLANRDLQLEEAISYLAERATGKSTKAAAN